MSEEQIEDRIAGNRKVIFPQKDAEMGIAYGITNDDSTKALDFRHAAFSEKFTSDQERKEAIDKFIADVGDYGDTIFWRVRPELWEERSLEYDKIEYWAYFRFSVGYSSAKDTQHH